MFRPASLVLAVGLAVTLPGPVRASVPAAGRPEVADEERAWMRQAIPKLRHLVRQLEADVAASRFCGPLEDVDSARRTLRELEWAYANGLPPPFKRPEPTAKPSP
jgi:hypothetical protein